jgi:hypothetical protein
MVLFGAGWGSSPAAFTSAWPLRYVDGSWVRPVMRRLSRTTVGCCTSPLFRVGSRGSRPHDLSRATGSRTGRGCAAGAEYVAAVAVKEGVESRRGEECGD